MSKTNLTVGHGLSVLLWACIVLAIPFSVSRGSTPHGQPSYCGAANQPSCPPPVPLLSPWQYTVDAHYNATPPNATFHSPADINAWYNEYFTAHGWCSTSNTGIVEGETEWGQVPDYVYGIIVGDSFTYSYYDVYYNAQIQSPSCNYNSTSTANVLESRTINCPQGYTLTYQSSPPAGPTCAPLTPPPPPIIPMKQVGDCKPCTGTAVSPTSNVGGTGASRGRESKGNPVDLSNGNKFQAEIDYAGAGTNPIEFVRSYNSLAAQQQYINLLGGGAAFPIGIGWTATYFQTLIQVAVTDNAGLHQSVYAFRPDGKVLIFNSYGGAYTPDGDVTDSLLQTSSGWEYQTADDTIETYNTSGQLVSIAARGKAPLTIGYPAAGDPPSSVSDGFGHTLQFTYIVDSGGYQRLGSISDPAGQPIVYSYGGYGNLSAVQYPDGTTRQYGYGSSGAANALTTLTDEAGVAYASWTYGSQYLQVLSSQHAGGVDAYSFSYTLNNNAITSAVAIDPLGQSRTYSQQVLWGISRVTSSSAYCNYCDDDASRTLDANGNILNRTDFNGHETVYTYTNNLETSRTEASGTAQARTITTVWDPSWTEPDSVTEPNRTTAWTYDGMGNVLTKTVTDTTVSPTVSRTWTYTYDSYGRMLTAQGPRTDVNSTTTYQYYTCTSGAQCGELQTITDALGHVTTFNTYNAHGQPLTITDPNGVVTTLTYDLRQRVVSIEVGTETTSYTYWPTGLVKLVTLPDASTILYTYDGAHRLTTITDGLGNYVSYTLDAMGNRTAENWYDPSNTLHLTHSRVFNALDELYQDINAAGTAAVTTTLGYDSQGNLTSSAAPLSRNTGRQFDALNRLDQITDPKNGVTTLGYDANDNLASVKDPRSLSTSYGHNGFNDLVSIVSPDTGTRTNTYDSGGNLKTSIDARGAVGTYSYDALNRLTQEAYGDQTLIYTYDHGTNGVGRLTGVSDAFQSMSWSYDANGRVNKKTQFIANQSVTKTVSYTYTNDDLTTLVTPSGQTIAYGYTNHRITSITVNGATLLNNVTYSPFGAVTGWTWGNSTTVSRTYTQDGDVNVITTAGDAITYTYDNAERVNGITDAQSSGYSWGPGSGSTYMFDVLDRLTSAVSTGNGSYGWSYDANGNRTAQTGSQATAFTISPTSNQVSSSSGAFAYSFVYDAAGNTTNYSTLSFTYNDRGRVGIEVPSGGSNTYYVYSAQQQVLERYYNTVGGFLLVYDEGGHILGEYEVPGALTEETVWMGDIPVATLRPSGTGIAIYYVHSDQINAPRKVTRPSDNGLMWRWDPNPFAYGFPNQNPAGLGSFYYNLRLPGQMYISQGGDHTNGFRDYDVNIGRYVESDPIGLDGESYSTYAYANGNPVSGYDPLGLFAVTSPKPGINTIVCDGDNGIEPQLLPLDPTSEGCGIGDCIKVHELIHIADVLAANKSICRGKPKGMRIVATSKSESAATEIKASQAEIDCLKNNKKNCDTCGPIIKARIAEMEKYRDSFK